MDSLQKFTKNQLSFSKNYELDNIDYETKENLLISSNGIFRLVQMLQSNGVVGNQ